MAPDTYVAEDDLSTIGKWDLKKLQTFCMAKNPVNETKWQRTLSPEFLILAILTGVR